MTKRTREFEALQSCQRLFVEPGNTEEIYGLMHMYREGAECIRSDPEAKGFIDSLLDGFEAASDRKIPNTLCAPSGTGKTQLAFSFPRDRIACIYLNIAAGGPVQSTPMNDAFSGFMKDVVTWLKEDYAHSGGESYRIYGFLQALLRLLLKHPGLNLPVDLSLLKVSKESFPDAEAIGLGDSDMVQSELRNWHTVNPDRRIVFFVDDYIATDWIKQEELDFFRQKLVEIGACVVVACPVSPSFVRAAYNPNLDFFDDRIFVAAPWINLCTELPKYVPPTWVRTAINACPNPAVKTLFELCINSRPVFAQAVAESIGSYLTDESNTFENIVDFVERLRDRIFSVVHAMKGGESQESLCALVGATLMAYGASPTILESPMALFGEPPDRNFAYLTTKPQGDWKSGRFEQWSLRHRKPEFVTLWRAGSAKPQYQASENTLVVFPYNVFYPDPQDDFLLYLVTAGNVQRPGIDFIGRRGFPVRWSTAYLIHEVLRCRSLSNDVFFNFCPSFCYHETVVCAAFFMACNAGSLRGCATLEELVTRFVTELVGTWRVSFPTLAPVDKIPWRGHLSPRFLLPFDTQLPRSVEELLNMGRSIRPSIIDSIDAAVYSPNSDKFEITVHAKSTIGPWYVKAAILNVLQRMDSNAKVSFIVVDSDIPETLRIDPTQFCTINRNEKIGARFAKGEYMDARLFKVGIDETRRVVLVPLDGARLNKKADRVIFVISNSSNNSTCERLSE